MKMTKEVIDNYIRKLELKIRDLEIDINESIKLLETNSINEGCKNEV